MNRVVTPAKEVSPRSPWRVTEVVALPEYRLRVTFADGLRGIVDISGLVHSANAGVFAVLADPYLFAKVTLENGAVVWPGELDLAPDAMYAAIQEHKVWSL
jgi:hypothetical protein